MSEYLIARKEVPAVKRNVPSTVPEDERRWVSSTKIESTILDESLGPEDVRVFVYCGIVHTRPWCQVKFSSLSVI